MTSWDRKESRDRDRDTYIKPPAATEAVYVGLPCPRPASNFGVAIVRKALVTARLCIIMIM